MIAFFLSYVYFTRQLGVAVFVLVVQTLIYGELVRLASKASVEAQMPGFRFFYVFWFCVFSFYMYGSVLKPHLLRALAGAGAVAGEAGLLASCLRCLEWIVRHHVLLSFSLYTLGFVAFVVSLRQRKNFKYQFQQFGFCHLALILVVGQSTYFVSNVFQGLFWLMLPVTLVVVNDSFAYIFGFLFGRTPLIRLSPKKTVEGFLGGAASTFVAALLATSLLTSLEAWDIKYMMLCPASSDFGLTLDRCDTDSLVGGLFKGTPLAAWPSLAPYVPSFASQWHLSPMQLHALVLAAFASVVAPFGGFFASGFKRAFNVKDFGNTIPGEFCVCRAICQLCRHAKVLHMCCSLPIALPPLGLALPAWSWLHGAGHGGFTDRMDCQIVMGAFAAIYLQYVLRAGVDEDALAAFTRAVDRMRGGELAALHGLLGCLLGRLPQLASGAALPSATIADAADACRLGLGLGAAVAGDAAAGL